MLREGGNNIPLAYSLFESQDVMRSSFGNY